MVYEVSEGGELVLTRTCLSPRPARRGLGRLKGRKLEEWMRKGGTLEGSKLLGELSIDVFLVTFFLYF